jgi:competence protein ComEC
MNRTILALLMAVSLGAAPTTKPVPKAAPAAPAPAPAAAAKPAPKPAAPAPAAAGADVGNKDSKIFHRADCRMVGKMKESNKVPFANAAEAIKAGYTACKICKPE